VVSPMTGTADLPPESGGAGRRGDATSERTPRKHPVIENSGRSASVPWCARLNSQKRTDAARALLRIEATRRLLAHSPSLSPEAVIGQAPLVQQTASGAACHGGTVAVHQEH
jgi:hypothetical protein